MKRSLVVLTILLSLFAGVATAATNSGTAVIPHYQAAHTIGIFETFINLSNITDQNINVKVILYNSDGTILTDTDNDPLGGTIKAYDNILNYLDNLTDASLSFTLGANSSCRFVVTGNDSVRGYGVIKWEQDSKAVCGLVAHGIGFYSGANYSSGRNMVAIPINNGLPF